MELTDEKKGIIFRKLAEMPLYETGVAFGLDKHYKDAKSVKSKVHRIYQEVQKDPARYFVSQDVVDTISGIVSSRNPQGQGRPLNPTLRETTEVVSADENDVSKLVLSGRAKAFKLLHKKLDQVGRNKKSLEAVSLAQLTTTAAILFDKGQIISGQATENVAILAKIDSNMSPDDALAAVLGMREQNIIAKEKKT